ncbi:basic blue protein-like protein [Carex littledalei]|uniref:Plantacyanin n=1 Tax=Carex littledalei TaxID=544730 RepID=A0A833RH57_9POAL|nr:basic blue protein-like protein [Carex littledalei]
MGIGSSSKIVALAMLLLVCLYHADAETHAVGGSQGWGFSVSYDSWTNGKAFTAGDTLVFNYQQGLHNVVPVSAAGHRSCRASSNSKVGTTGGDKFTLRKGPNYFICSIPGHCTAGMKILVVAN